MQQAVRGGRAENQKEVSRREDEALDPKRSYGLAHAHTSLPIAIPACDLHKLYCVVVNIVTADVFNLT